VHTSWANTSKADALKRTEPGRRAFLERFEREVDPDGTLPPDERRRRAEHARKAYMASLALKSARARRKAKRAPGERLPGGADAKRGAA
jgi:hypothetical protein